MSLMCSLKKSVRNFGKSKCEFQTAAAAGYVDTASVNFLNLRAKITGANVGLLFSKRVQTDVHPLKVNNAGIVCEVLIQTTCNVG